jgi:hypothetical protein
MDRSNYVNQYSNNVFVIIIYPLKTPFIEIQLLNCFLEFLFHIKIFPFNWWRNYFCILHTKIDMNWSMCLIPRFTEKHCSHFVFQNWCEIHSLQIFIFIWNTELNPCCAAFNCQMLVQDSHTYEDRPKSANILCFAPLSLRQVHGANKIPYSAKLGQVGWSREKFD